MAARRSIREMPDCPPYLSEPAYARLVFDVHCYVRRSLYMDYTALIYVIYQELPGYGHEDHMEI